MFRKSAVREDRDLEVRTPLINSVSGRESVFNTNVKWGGGGRGQKHERGKNWLKGEASREKRKQSTYIYRVEIPKIFKFYIKNRHPNLQYRNDIFPFIYMFASWIKFSLQH